MREKYLALWEQYVEELGEAKKIAEEWWTGLIAREPAEDRKKAILNIQRRWPDGPASHPRVIAVFQKYYRLCLELNKEEEDKEVVTYPPSLVLIEWLMSEETDELSKFLADLTYFPIGEDQDFNLI
jgi:hypothetical protein